MTAKPDLMNPLPAEMVGNRRVWVDSAQGPRQSQSLTATSFRTCPDAELPHFGSACHSRGRA
jgi:hypothetical protein